MIVCHLSDTHQKHSNVKIPKCDMIIHSGDFDAVTFSSFMNFINWYSCLDVKYKILVAGNHDLFCEKNRNFTRQICKENAIIYLESESVNIEGINIYGTPITPKFYNWAFMRERGEEIEREWSKIPNNTDILITHGPPYKILDLTDNNEHAGCYLLYLKILDIKPKYNLFGHIHRSYGIYKDEHTTYINSALLDDRYRLVRQPHLFEIKK